VNSSNWIDITFAQLIHAFTPTVGVEESKEVVLEVARGMGIQTDPLNQRQTLEILNRLAQREGMVGITARFVKARVESGRLLPDAPAGQAAEVPEPGRLSLSDGWPAASEAFAEPVVIERARLVALLARNLGAELAEESFTTAARTLRLTRDAYTEDETMAILDALAEAPGVVGTTARFAKARLILKPSQPR
jgi:hypothetical protein